MAEYSREQRNQLSRVIASSDTESRQLKEIVDNRLKQRGVNCSQLANLRTIAGWAANLTNLNPNWGKRLDRGVGIVNARRLRNEHIIERALIVHGIFTNSGDVVDFAIHNGIEITDAYINASPRGIGWAFTPSLANILGLNDIGRILRGAGQNRTAPNSHCLHHHDGDNINCNIIYINVGGHQYVLGIYNRHMTQQNMGKAQQAAVDAIESRYPGGPWTKIIEHGTNRDAVNFPW